MSDLSVLTWLGDGRPPVEPCPSEGQSSIPVNSPPSPALFLTVSLRCATSPRTSEDSEEPDQHPKGHSEARQVSPGPARPRCRPSPGQGQPTALRDSQTQLCSLQSLSRVPRGATRPPGSGLTASCMLTPPATSVLAKDLPGSSHYPNFVNFLLKERIIEGGKNKICRYLNKPMQKRDISTWDTKSLCIACI